MTEYWQSQARKYCEFCKCWLADNKVSISFHENGKRHKESVAKHISTLSKRSAKEQKQQGKLDHDLKKMEEAAMKAYMKDVQNNADCDYTSQKINAMLEASGSKSAAPPPAAPPPAPAVAKKPPVWHEVKQDVGSYFWNTETNETTWDPPDEYLSIAELEEQELRNKEKEKLKEQENKEKQKEALKEAKAHAMREQMRVLAAPAQPRPLPAARDYGPAPRPAPYGTWTAVVHETVEPVDLQLPETIKKPPPPVVVQPEVIKFKEKKVDSLGDGPVEFKRRKIANRSSRQKTSDD